MTDNVRKAVIAMAYDNGVIHSGNTEESVANRVMDYLETVVWDHDMNIADAELGRMTPEDFETATCGEQGLVVISPTLEKVLNEAFDAL